MTLGRSSDAIAHMDTAARLDPLAPAIQSDFGRVLYRARKYDQAIVRLNRALELEPAMGWLVYHRLADVYEKQGQYDRAVVALRRAGGAHRLRPLGAELARVAARMGYRAAAEQLMRDMDQSSGAPLNAKAAAYAALGDHDTAFRLLFEHVDSNSPGPNFVAVDPLFDVLHSDPRWKELLRRIRHSPSAEARRVG
jgi:tetratricopeptide (TPR) repeat protein